ncbi:HAD-IC family P-type ATPase [Hyphomicrobium sp. xq]|uniref:HAD-IC family P-type ATPase n=1 Tax=Hyphomicrobium album TaxID=2665159 RepID=A0A6I3KMT7_9HYPH|nr:HAD-IC family P-type ATPase [Hyphomicrobium album]MTD95769.1 HAD-IC family P-type ATPase [Hyphomicrobium album]
MPTGLSDERAADLLQKFGHNELPAAARKGLLARAAAQIANPLIYVLLCSAAISALLGHAVDTAIILAVVSINAAIGMVQEGRAEQALAAIRNLISARASVRRDGRRIIIPASEVVPGDVLLLEAGDRVAADGLLIRARNMSIDESILTGESVPVSKVSSSAHEDTFAGEESLVFSGTLVAAGQGTVLVKATGIGTRLGRITTLLERVEELETPLIRQMNVFARRVTGVILAVSSLALTYAWLIGGYPLTEAFMIVVSMAVAGIPEALPAVTTITMAVGVQRMAKRHAILRRLPAIETLGCVSTICSDKTGTLTKNEMTVSRLATAGVCFQVGGVGYEPRGGFTLDGLDVDPDADPTLLQLLRAAALCNDAALRETDHGWVVDGDPLEGALLVAAIKAGLSIDNLQRSTPRLDEIPFDTAHRYMASLHRCPDGAACLYVKGAPERILDMCSRQRTADGPAAIDRAYWRKAVEQLAATGFRVIAVASKPTLEKGRLAFADVDDLVVEGLIGLIDPPREEAIAAIAQCRSAGIAVKMITGDHVGTAAAIARELGLDVRQPAVAGELIDALDDDALRRLVAEANVFARATPEHKLRLVQALQARGDVVVMTGDGVNDAPALKRADVGVAMGRNGTEAAKEAAEMVLVDDNFASIVAAVREGRAVYDNLKKVIGWTMPTNGGEAMIIVLALAFGLTLPITPVQVLWINTVTAVGLGLVLAFEPAEPDIMQRGPRAGNEQLLSGFLIWRVLLVSALFAIGAFGVFEWALHWGYGLDAARTMVVNAIVIMEIAYLFSVRYLSSTSLTLRGALGTPAVLLGVGCVSALQVAFTYVPFMNELFDTRPVPLGPGLAILAVGVALFFILELEKRVQRQYGDFIERCLAMAEPPLRGWRRSIQRSAARLRRRLG